VCVAEDESRVETILLQCTNDICHHVVELDLECNFFMQDICLIYGTRHFKEVVSSPFSLKCVHFIYVDMHYIIQGSSVCVLLPIIATWKQWMEKLGPYNLLELTVFTSW
jgi:hypothetical protein